MATIRLISLDDVAVLTGLALVNRAYLAPWDPVRAEAYYSEDGQRAVVAMLLERYALGTMLPYVIVADDGRVAGRVTLHEIVRGPVQAGVLGYWVNQADTGRGLATAAVAALARVAFQELGLHRLEAATLLHNAASQRVLERNGFRRIGLAPQYLCIQGRWQDHVLFQLLDPAAAPGCT